MERKKERTKGVQVSLELMAEEIGAKGEIEREEAEGWRIEGKEEERERERERERG